MTTFDNDSDQETRLERLRAEVLLCDRRSGNSSDKDNQLYFRYYADEDYRRELARDWPADPMPGARRAAL